MVGVPALWEMLHRRIKTRLRERGDWFADLADNVIEFNAWIRDNTPFNLGPIIFFPIHQGMGGKMRYLISGGSALSEKVQKDLHGLGFTVLEGYGLTESSPVLTVARPGNKLLARKRRQTAAGRRGQNRQPGRKRRRRSSRARAEYDARLLQQRRSDRSRSAGPLAENRRSRASSTRTEISLSSAVRRTSLSIRTAKIFTPTRSKTFTASRLLSRS